MSDQAPRFSSEERNGTGRAAAKNAKDLKEDRVAAERELDEILAHFEDRKAETAPAEDRGTAETPKEDPPRRKPASRPVRRPEPENSPYIETVSEPVPVKGKKGKKRKNGKRKKGDGKAHPYRTAFRKAWNENDLVRDIKQIHRSGKGKKFPDSAKARIRQIGPITKAVKADPVRRERAYQAIIWILALLLAMHMISCLNDITGFNRSDKMRTVTLETGMTTNEVIGELDRAGLIKHSTFCKFFVATLSNVDGSATNYLPGDYGMSRDMGVENMLIMSQGGRSHETVQITIPEGYTVEQIAEDLEKNKVCSKEDFYKACDSTRYDYDYLKDLDNVNQRYHAIEGFLYPDTYEFYKGEAAKDVVSRLLSNFDKKWNEEFAARAEERGMTVDEVVRLASVIQKEDSKYENMQIISSVFQNRLNSSTYPMLQSDATSFYVNRYIKPYVSAEAYKTYFNLYSTYKCRGLPVGPICSPGEDAIRSVLWPASTNYYFFAHDDDGNLYAAQTNSGQAYNLANAQSSSSEDNV